ncbi:MAG: endonuclease VIII [Gammaproteobacteria bacterium]|nr:endonuclease VIII [Gammaproteobacteria bacterium]
MPEGPEIRIEADRIARVLVGHTVDEAFFGLPRLRHFRRQVEGAGVEAVDTHGKAMLTRFDNGLTLYSHNQLYGRWYVKPRGELPATGRSLRVALHTEAASALLYSASEIAVLDDNEVATHPFLARLGPDLLDASLAWRDIAARLRSPRFCNRALGSLYLDQQFIAGIGNYLRSEILFFARVHPSTKPSQLTVKQRNELARQTLAVGERAYRSAGITNAPARVKKLKALGQRRGQLRFAAFARAGRPCYDCGATISKINVGSRRLYLCPTCQPPGD